MSKCVAQGRDDDRGQQQKIVDPVLAYVQAWDAKRFGDLEKVLTMADAEEALNIAFLAIFRCFDPALPYTEQLLRLRLTGHIGA